MDTSDDYFQTTSEDDDEVSELSPSSSSSDDTPPNSIEDEPSKLNVEPLHVHSVDFSKETNTKTFKASQRHGPRKRTDIFDEHVKVVRLKRSDLCQLSIGASLIRFSIHSRRKSSKQNDHDHLQQSKTNFTFTSAKTGTMQESSQRFLFSKPIVTRISSWELLSASQIVPKDQHVVVTRIARKI